MMNCVVCKKGVNTFLYICIICRDLQMCGNCEQKHEETHPVLKQCVNHPSNLRPGDIVRNPAQRSFAKFLQDLTIHDRSVHVADTVITKCWQLQNVGKNDWMPGYRVIRISGDEMTESGTPREIELSLIRAGEIFEVAIDIRVPAKIGRFVAYYRLVNLRGERFGPRFWLDIISVKE